MPRETFRALVIALSLLFVFQSNALQLILRPNRMTCTILISSFDPIKVQAKFPAIVNKRPGQRFRISLINLKTQANEQQKQVQDNLVFRNNYYLQSNVIYDLCFEFITEREFGPNQMFLMGFNAEEHFESMIGQLQVPPELAKDQNLKVLFETGSRMNELNNVIADRQKKERELEDELVHLSSRKSKRIMTMTVIECGVIILSGIYQIFAIRKILIQKNLY